MVVAYGFHRILLANKDEASDVLETMKLEIKMKGFVGLDEYHQMCGVVGHFLDRVTGWTNLDGVEIKGDQLTRYRLKDEPKTLYYLDLPEPAPLAKEVT